MNRNKAAADWLPVVLQKFDFRAVQSTVTLL